VTSSRWLLLGAVGFTFLAWASAFVVIRGVGEHLDGGPLALGRLAVGTVALGILVLLARRWVWPTRREWVQLAVYGVAWFGAYNVALNTAEQTLDAGTAAMIVGIGPILIALGAGIFLGEGIPKWLAIGAVVAFAGVLLIGVGTLLASGTAHPFDLVGAALALVAAITYAIGVLTQKPVVRRIPAIQAYALKRMPAGQLGIASYLSPPLATLMGFLAFQEIPHPLALAGGVVCLIGVALSRRRPRVVVPA
jgi:drug/metabolite transporter (DMT)-like permease